MKLTKKQKEWLEDRGLIEPPKCKMCDNDITWRYKGGGHYSTYCSRDCQILDQSTINQRREQTMIKKYGVKNTRQLKNVNHKIKQTNLEKYGVEYPIQNNEILTKMKQTMLDTHGVENISYLSEFRDKAKQTMLEKYGVEHTLQSKVLWNKVKQTNVKKYGMEYITQTQHFQKQRKDTMVEKYGVEYYLQQHIIDILPLLEDYDWLYDQYIVQNKTAIQITKELNIGGSNTIGNYLRKLEIQIRQYTNYSYKCIQWLESIIQSDNIHIRHAINGGEYQIPGTRYKADGYCKETNTIYEFHGDYWHGNPNVYDSNIINESTRCTMGDLYRKTLLKEEKIKELGYNLVVRWEND